MRKTIFLTISMVAFGCSAQRHAVKSEETASAETVTVCTSAADITEQTRTETYMTLSEEIITETVVFDTSQPVDSATGTPPLKSRTVERRRIRTEAGQEVADDRRESVTQTAESRKEERSESRTVERSHKGMNPLQRWLCIIGSVAVLAGVVWIVRRFIALRY